MPFCNSPAERRYLIRTFAAALAYIVATFITIHLLFHGRTSLHIGLLLATIPSIPLIAMIAIVALYLKEEKDEFQRELYIKALLWAMGATLAVTSFWSYAHLFTHIPPVDGFHVFVLFWVFTGLSTPFIRFRYTMRGTSE